jgi:hypothetical protein
LLKYHNSPTAINNVFPSFYLKKALYSHFNGLQILELILEKRLLIYKLDKNPKFTAMNTTFNDGKTTTLKNDYHIYLYDH